MVKSLWRAGKKHLKYPFVGIYNIKYWINFVKSFKPLYYEKLYSIEVVGPQF